MSFPLGASESRPTEATLLVVDDEPDICQGLQEYFEGAFDHLRVVTAMTAEDGERKAAETAPAAILFDFRLPSDDGLEMVRRIREDRPSVPVFMMTAFAGRDLFTFAFDRYEVDGVFAKPLDMRVVLREVGRPLLTCGAQPRVQAQA